MNEVAAAREQLRSAARSFTSLRATRRLWCDGEVLQARDQYLGDAWRAAQGWVASPWVNSREGQSSVGTRFEEHRGSIWVRQPSEVRIEQSEYVLVMSGDRWWEVGRGFGPVAGQDGGIVKGKLELERVAFMLDPSPFAAMEGLSLAGADSVGGRAATRLKSPEPADPASLLSPGIGWASFSPEFELWIDTEHGIVLRTVERFRGHDFQVTELLDVAFEAPISDEVFTLVLPAGEEFRRYEDICPRRLPVDQAVEAVPFTMFVPQNVPPEAGSWDGEVLFEPLGGWLGLGFIDRNQIPQTRVNISEEAGSLDDDEEDLADYEYIEHEGEPIRIRSGESKDGTWYSLLLSRSGTRISIDSLLSREASIAIARWLKPLKAS
jgi:hypothetical protein